MKTINWTFEPIIIDDENTIQSPKAKIARYDCTTTEHYRVKRLYRIDPLTDNVVPDNLAFEFRHKWNPVTGERDGIDEIGPLVFDAVNLYNYYFVNRYKGLWYPAEGGFQARYGDCLGKTNQIVDKGTIHPERYLFRLPIIDCYLSPSDNGYSLITMGPELTDEEIDAIDKVVCSHHPLHSSENFVPLKEIKRYYDLALVKRPNTETKEYNNLREKYLETKKTLTSTSSVKRKNRDVIKELYNRYWVDKLVNINYCV